MLTLPYGVTGGTRIHDNQSHNLVFYQLNYGHMEQVMGIEPTPTAWQAIVLTVILHLHILADRPRFELRLPVKVGRISNPLGYHYPTGPNNNLAPT